MALLCSLCSASTLSSPACVVCLSSEMASISPTARLGRDAKKCSKASSNAATVGATAAAATGASSLGGANKACSATKAATSTPVSRIFKFRLSLLVDERLGERTQSGCPQEGGTCRWASLFFLMGGKRFVRLPQRQCRSSACDGSLGDAERHQMSKPRRGRSCRQWAVFSPFAAARAERLFPGCQKGETRLRMEQGREGGGFQR